MIINHSVEIEWGLRVQEVDPVTTEVYLFDLEIAA